MVKRRLIFTLLMQNGVYMLSRNFSLQGVGDKDWISSHYNFDAIAFSIDELIVLNVDRGGKNVPLFAENLTKLNAHCFMPITSGGGIRNLEHAKLLLRAGSDKLTVNTPLFEDPELVKGLVKNFGSQCIVASIDYKKKSSGQTEVFFCDGERSAGMDVARAAALAESLGCGEIYLTSMDRDGTGQGYDLEVIQKISEISKVPVIASGGVGKYEHLAEGVLSAKADAVSTANLFNFIEDGLTEARECMQNSGIEMAVWEKTRGAAR